MDMIPLLYRIRRKLQVLAFDIFGPVTMSKVYFRIVLRQKLNIQEPKTFNEKIQWYKLYYCPYSKDVVTCSDKYRIRDYLLKKGLIQYAIPLIGVWKSAAEIVWDELPERFVLKCNHGCAYNIICPNKSEVDKNKVLKQLDKWMHEDFGKFNAEIHYSLIKPLIVGEEYLGDGSSSFLIDYKLHCFNGKAKFVLICSDREGNKSNYDYYDLEWKRLDYSMTDLKPFPCPKSFDEMIYVAEKIAEDFPFVRVDFYEINGKPVLGELTFVPAGGLDDTLTQDADIEIGNMLELK